MSRYLFGTEHRILIVKDEEPPLDHWPSTCVVYEAPFVKEIETAIRVSLSKAVAGVKCVRTVLNAPWNYNNPNSERQRLFKIIRQHFLDDISNHCLEMYVVVLGARSFNRVIRPAEEVVPHNIRTTRSASQVAQSDQAV